MTTWIPGLTGAQVTPSNALTPAVALSVKSAELTFDRTWAPYIQGSLTCRLLSAADATATDPRAGAGLLTRFTMTQQQVGGATQSQSFALWLRSRVNDFQADQATLRVASVESMFQDHVDVYGGNYGAATPDTTMVNDILKRSNLANNGYVTLTNPDSQASFTVAKESALWNPGLTLFDIARAVEEPASLWLHGDETGIVMLRTAAGYVADTSTKYLYGADQPDGTPGRVLTVQDTIDRDSPDWANAVIIAYNRTGTEVSNSTFDWATAPSNPSPIAWKSNYIARQGSRTFNGEAQSRVNRMVKRGRTLQVEAITDLTCRPNQRYFVGFRDVSWYGIVRSVTFRHPSATMTVTIDITESQS